MQLRMHSLDAEKIYHELGISKHYKAKKNMENIVENYFNRLKNDILLELHDGGDLKKCDKVEIKKLLVKNPPISAKEWKNYLLTKTMSRIRSERPDIALPEIKPLFLGIQEELEKGHKRPLRPLPKNFSLALIEDCSKLLEFFSNGILVQEYYKCLDLRYKLHLSESIHLPDNLEKKLIVFKALAVELLSSQQLNQLTLLGIPQDETRVMLTLYGNVDEIEYKSMSQGLFDPYSHHDIFMAHALNPVTNIAFDPVAQSDSATNNNVIHGSLAHLISFMSAVLAINDNILRLDHRLDTIVKASLEIEWLADAKGIREAGSTVKGSLSSVWGHWDSTGGLAEARVSPWPKELSLNCADDITTEISDIKKYPHLSALQHELAHYLTTHKKRFETGKNLRPLIPHKIAYEFIPPLSKLKELDSFELQKWQKGHHLYSRIKTSHKDKNQRIIFLSENSEIGKKGFSIIKKYYSNVSGIFWSPKNGQSAKSVALDQMRISQWDRLIAWKADLIIPKDILDKGICENFHPAPRNAPGLGFIERALINPKNFQRGEWQDISYMFGGTYHVMTEEIDAGTILAEYTFKYNPKYTYGQLSEQSDQHMLYMLEDLAWYTKHFPDPRQSIILKKNGETLSWSGEKLNKTERELLVLSAPSCIQDQIKNKERSKKTPIVSKLSFFHLESPVTENHNKVAEVEHTLDLSKDKAPLLTPD